MAVFSFGLFLAGEAWALPDLFVQTISVSPTSPTQGQNYTISAVVKNQGNATASAGLFANQELFYFVNGTNVTEANYDDLAANATITLTSQSLTAPAAGTITITAKADANSEVTESNESNNTSSSLSVTIQSPPLPDLIVHSISVSPTSPMQGQSYTITAVVKNQGNATASAGLFANQELFYYVNSTKVAEVDYDDLAAGATITLTSASLTAPAAGTITITAKADASSEVTENNESNNEATATVTVQVATTSTVSATLTLTVASQVTAGQSLAIAARVRNTGPVARSFQVGAEIRRGNTVVQDLNSRTTVSVGSTAADTVSFNYNTPVNLAAGTYTVRVIVWSGAPGATGSTLLAVQNANFTILAPSSTPSGPTPADGAVLNAQPMKLDWADASGATSYDVYLKVGSGTFSRVGTDLASSEWSLNQPYNATLFSWYVVAKNSAGTTTGPTWTYGISVTIVTLTPAITAWPRGTTIDSGQTAKLSVIASGPSLTYQWYRGVKGDTANPITGATAASFTTPALTATTSYWVRVTNNTGSADRNVATVLVATAASTTISGRVIEVTTKLPVSGATVTIASISTRTDSNGVFLLAAMGTMATLSRTGYVTVSRSITAAPGTSKIDLGDIAISPSPSGRSPAIAQIRPQYDGLFLQGVSLTNRVDAQIDWNGNTPGRVDWYVNGVLRASTPATGSTVSTTFNMVSDFQPGLNSANRLEAVAVTAAGSSSPALAMPVRVIPTPGFLLEVPKGDMATSTDGLDLKFTFELSFPKNPASAVMALPFLGKFGGDFNVSAGVDYTLPSGEWEVYIGTANTRKTVRPGQRPHSFNHPVMPRFYLGNQELVFGVKGSAEGIANFGEGLKLKDCAVTFSVDW